MEMRRCDACKTRWLALGHATELSKHVYWFAPSPKSYFFKTIRDLKVRTGALPCKDDMMVSKAQDMSAGAVRLTG